MSERVLKLVIDASGANTGAQQYSAAIDSIAAKTAKLGGGLNDLGDNTSFSKMAANAQTASSANDKLSDSTAKSAAASRTRAQAVETEAQAQARISKMVDDSISKYERERAAALASADAKRKAAAIAPDNSGTTFAAQNKVMGLGSAGKIPADVLNGTKELGQAEQGIKKTEEAIKDLTGSTKLSAGAFREMIVLVREASRGDFTRMAGSASILAQRMGAIEAIGPGVLLGFGAIAAAVGLVGYAFLKGSEDEAKLNNTLAISRNGAGLTADSYEDMAKRVAAASDTTRASAESIMGAFINKGDVSKTAIEDLSDSVVKFARMTGQSQEDVAADWAKMADDPVKFAETLSQSYYLVTQSGEGLSANQIQLARDLWNAGDKMAAVDAIASGLKKALDQQSEDVGYLTKVWRGLKNAIADAAQALMDFGKTGTPLGNAKDKLAALQAKKKNDDEYYANLGMTRPHSYIDDQIAVTTKEIATLQATTDAQAKASEKARAANAATIDANNAMAGSYKTLTDRTYQYNQALADLNRRRDAANANLKANPNNAQAKETANFYNSQYNNIRKGLQKQYEPVTTKANEKAAREAEAAARREAREAAERAKREKEFYDQIEAQADAVGKLPLQADELIKRQQLEKILGRDLADSAADQARLTRLNNDLTEQHTAKIAGQLKLRNDDAKSQNDFQASTLGLTDRQIAMEQAGHDAEQAALKEGITLADKRLQIEIARAKENATITYDLQQQNKWLASGLAQFSAIAARENQRETLLIQQKANDDSYNDGAADSPMVKMYGAQLAKVIHDQAQTALQTAIDQLKLQPLKDLSDISPTAQMEYDRQTADATYKVRMAELDSLHLTPQARKQISDDIEQAHRNAMNEARDYTYTKWADMFSSLADLFGGKLGNAFAKAAQAINDILANSQGKGTGIGASLSNLLGQGGTFSQASSNFLNGTAKLGDVFSAGSLSKSFATGLAYAEAGSKIGGTIGGIGDALGIKNFSKGASIGGTIGGLTGNPIIAAAASVVGGIISSLFYKAPKGQATIHGGNASDVSLSGTSAQLKSQASGMAGEVQSGLADVAKQLGATIGSFAVSIGTYKDHFRVNPTGGAVGGVKGSGAIQYDSEADAVKAAIEFAIKQGALQGLSDFEQKAVKALDIDSAIQAVQDFNAAMSDFQSIADPVMAAVKAITDPLDKLRATMVQVGASTADLTKIDQYRADKLDAALKQQLASITDFQKTLRGDGSGVTKLNQLNADLAQFQDYKTKIAAGDSSVNQQDFTQLGQEIFSLAGTVYGTATQQFQDIRASLTDTTNQLATNVTNAFNAAAGTSTTSSTSDATTQTVNAITGMQNSLIDALNNQTNAIVGAITGSGVANDNSLIRDNPLSINGVYKSFLL